MGDLMDISELRKDFPTMREGDGVYLDSACQSLRPDSVIDAVLEYYRKYPSCGSRSVHSMSSKVAMTVDETREALMSFFGTDDPDCYIFTKNCTEGMNIVAFGSGLKKGDAVVTTDSEHNSNHVPWLMMADNVGISRKFARTSEDGSFDIESFKDCMGKDVKLVSVLHASNVTGCVMPIKEITEIAHDHGAKVLVDGSQAAPHIKVDLKDLDVDYYSMSVHKMLGPSGMGVLYGKKENLKDLRPLAAGGGAVGMVGYDKAEFAPVPEKFEPGLQNYSGIFGTKAALEYLSAIGMCRIMDHDRMLMRSMFDMTKGVDGLEMVGPNDPEKRCGVFSFNIRGLGPHDVAMMMDSIDGIMIRSGMHCAGPFYESRNLKGSARASVYLYNNRDDIARFARTLGYISETFGDH